MGIFDKIKNPIFVKSDSEAEKQLEMLENIKKSLSGDALDKIEQEISKVEAGIVGEKMVRFELENSHMPMCVLHDLFLEDEGLTAQIDYMVLTRKNVYIIECKNLIGNIEINSSGDFIRSYQYKNRTFKEGIYSPITQNQRHIELIRSIRKKQHNNIITKALFEKSFDDIYHTIVVLANPKTILNAKYAKKEVKEKVIRADQLVAYIKAKDAATEVEAFNEKKLQEMADFFLQQNKNNPVDYVEKFHAMVEESKSEETQTPNCPLCGSPMIIRIAKTGANKGGQFYGCSTYPKCKGIRSLT